MKGFKVTENNMTCLSQKYVLGKEYQITGQLQICQNGFHFCKKLEDCFTYYDFNTDNRVFEVIASGGIVTAGDKSCAERIKLVKELSWHEVLDILNAGKHNTGRNNAGDCNTGDYNVGHYNSGEQNTGNSNTGNRNAGCSNSGEENQGAFNTGECNVGNYNSGSRNVGSYNSGDDNTGDSNSGHGNSGEYNSGNFNSGFHNTGSYNSGNYSTGLFCTERRQRLMMFDEPTELFRNEYLYQPWFDVLRLIRTSIRVPIKNMTAKEKKENPGYKDAGSIFRTIPLRKAYALWWDKLKVGQRILITRMPNFDARKFKEITGINVNKPVAKKKTVTSPKKKK